MNTKRIEMIVLAVIIIASILAYIGKVQGWHTGFQFSMTMSIIVLVITLGSLLWILVRTIKGQLVGRRIVFLYVGIAVALPLFMSISQEIPISEEVEILYDAIDELPAGSKVLMSFDYDPPSAPELQPMADAVIALCFRKNLKVIALGLWPQGPQQANLAFDKVLDLPEIESKNLEYGIDYVNLGYQAGSEFVIQRMGSSFISSFRTDWAGRAYDDIPLLNGVHNFDNVDFGVNFSSGFVGTVEWVQVAVDRYGLKMGAGNTAVQAPTIYPYLRSGQVIGLMGGMSGGAEMERLVNIPGKATKFMLSQSLAHVIVMAFIIIGNVAFFRTGRKSKLDKE